MSLSCLLLVAGPALKAQAQAKGALTGSAEPIEELLVTAPRSLIDRTGSTGSSALIDAAAIERSGALHPNELAVQVPGVWVSRGSGQEHLTAIRSAVLTGPGACGAFAILEDGLPIRPSGFCNVNNLFELNTVQAAGVEVFRGPASAVLGGNALRGAINSISPVPTSTSLRVEGGAYDYYRVSATAALNFGDQSLGLAVHGDHSNGYRDATGYGQQRANLGHRMRVGNWQVLTTLSASNLNQETGGFVLGDDAYEVGGLRRSNPNPEAYRDAWSVRLASHWQRGDTVITPYARRSRMTFLQHFLPGQPLEQNEQNSAGVLFRQGFERGALRGSFGAQFEILRGSLFEDQDGPTQGSAFLVETRPAGIHYDYEVDGLMGAAFYDLNWQFAERWRLVHSARLEQLRYDYDNRFLVGNTRADGTTCGFGGCRYTRPADRDDRFTDLAGRLGILRTLGRGEAYLQVGSGFRAPQITELYRLQNGQLVTDLDSEQILSAELGYRDEHLSVALFRQRTRNLIFRDADGFNVSDGRTRALGIEASVRQRLGAHRLELVASYARHEYDADIQAGFEQIESGDEVDTAPRWLGSARWGWQLAPGLDSELELVHVGSHQINASNTASYPGHWLVNWRAEYRINDALTVFGRVHNLLDERYAERADFAFGNERYFPGMPRQLYLGVSWRPAGG
ncbi:MAG: TonB-dependent receptor [Pseudomonadota bacterium]